MNTTSTVAKIPNLEPGKMYQIFVVARNVHGTSLPSSLIVIRLEKQGKISIHVYGLSPNYFIFHTEGQWVKAVTSPPHSLAVASHSATWVTITWQPPEFSHPSEIITYRLYHKSTAEDSYHIENSTVTSFMISALSPNTQYIVYVTAVTDKGSSMPSETLIAWTDPAYPAFVEVKMQLKVAKIA